MLIQYQVGKYINADTLLQRKSGSGIVQAGCFLYYLNYIQELQKENYQIWCVNMQWSYLTLEKKILKSLQVAHNLILNIFVYLQIYTWREWSIFLQALNVKHVAALMSRNLWCGINSSISSYLTVLKLGKCFFCCTYENQSVYLVKCVD